MPAPRGTSRLGSLAGRARDFASRRRAVIAVVGSLATAAVLVFLLAGRREEFRAALSSAAIWLLAVTALLQIVALLARSEAWHLTIEAAGGTVDRRTLYRASSMQVLGSVVNGQFGVAARIAALRRSSPLVSPQVPTLIAAEFPILAAEAALAALASFTLIGPLDLAWWLPVIAIAVIATASAGLRHLALRKGRELWKGLAVLRSVSGGGRVIAFVLLAVFAQIFRNWMLLHAVGVDASLLDAIAVLIAVVTLGQLPIGPSVGAAAAVLILGSNGVAAAAAAGVLMTATGTIGGLGFAAWAGADRLFSGRRRVQLGMPETCRSEKPSEGSTVVVQGHFTAPAKRLRAEHRRPHAERRPDGIQFRPSDGRAVITSGSAPPQEAPSARKGHRHEEPVHEAVGRSPRRQVHARRLSPGSRRDGRRRHG